jgi:hypothetical protein
MPRFPVSGVTLSQQHGAFSVHVSRLPPDVYTASPAAFKEARALETLRPVSS